MQKYSVLMSVYNKVEVEHLNLSVRSMIVQTVKPEQIVLVLDGPINHNLQAVIHEFEQDYPELFTIVVLSKNHGLAYALNAGIAVCRNELIARMDSDDYSLPNRCEKQLDVFLSNPNLSLLGTGSMSFSNTVDETLPQVQKRPKNLIEIKRALRRNSPFSHPSVMYKKSAVMACGGYDSTLRRRQDYDLFAKMVLSMGYEAMNLEEPLICFRVGEDYISRNKNKESCHFRIDVQRKIYRRKECSLADFLYIWLAMNVSMILPDKVYWCVYKMIKTRKTGGRK